MGRQPHITYFKQATMLSRGHRIWATCSFVVMNLCRFSWACWPHQLCISPRRLVRIPAVEHTAPTENKDKSSTTKFILLCCSSVTKSCLTPCHPMYCSLPSFSVQWDFPGNNTGVGCHALLQGIFPPKNQTCVSYDSCIAGRFFIPEPLGICTNWFNPQNPIM